MMNKKKILKNAFCLIVIANIFTNVVYAQSLMDQRTQSASDLIKEISIVKAKAQQLHAHSEYVIAQAKRLQGETSKFEINIPPINAGSKLNKVQLESAKQQYQVDLQQFADHAKAYDAHLKQFQTLVGECHAQSQALAAVLKKYELHVSQFHLTMPNIRPPHICGALQGQFTDLSGVARQMMGDQVNVAMAEAKLNYEQRGAQLADNAVPDLQTKAILQARRAKGEAQLASEFGRLQEEYTLLKTEKDTINGAKPGSVVRSTVSGKLVNKSKD